jgi:ferredoxin
MPYWINDACIDCGACADVCPASAIETQRPPIAEPYLSIITSLNNIIQALYALQYNGERIELGDLAVILTGKATSLDSA